MTQYCLTKPRLSTPAAPSTLLLLQVARVVVSLFVAMFYIASLNIFLVALQCKPYKGRWEHLIYHIGAAERFWQL